MKLKLSIRARAAIVALCATSTVVGAACWQPDDTSFDDPEVQSVQQAYVGQPIGGLEGTVRASYPANGTRTTPLPGVDVWAQNVASGTTSPHVISDYNGRYYVPRVPGIYKICWSKTGFTSACTTSTFTVGARETVVGLSSVAVAGTTVLRGNVKLADGSPCLNVESLFGVNQSAVAEMLNASNVVLSSAKPNAQGEFVLPWPSGTRTLRVTCGSAVQSYLANAALDNTGGTTFQVTITNSRPHLDPITTLVGGVDVHQGVAAGAVVPLTVSATDPNADPLTYHWKVPANGGSLPDTGTSAATWTLPSIPGTYSAYVSVDDGKGGFATRKVDVTVRTSSTVLFTGTVHDRLKNGIQGATVRVGSLTTTSDARGNFSLSVPQAAVYLLDIEKVGYAELSRRLTQPATGREYILADSYQVAINPAVSNVIIDQRPAWFTQTTAYQRRGGKVTLPANSLDLTVPPVGQLYAYITTYDPVGEDMPGDMGAVNSASAGVYLVTHGAVFIEIRDSAGNKYNLASGKTATVEIPIQNPILNNDPAVASTIASWTYDVPTGNWIELAGGGTKVGDHYTLTVSHFSTKNADLEKTAPACITVNLDPGVPATLTSFINVEVAPNAPRRREFPLDQQSNTLYNLPTATPYTLQVTDKNGVFLNTVTGTTGAAYGNVGPPTAANLANCTKVTLSEDFLGTPGQGGAYQRFLSFKGFGAPQAVGTGYYLGIDPNTLRGNLKAFFTKNGFGADGSGGTRSSFINNGDLGFGRDMHCLQTGLDVACYVSNYGNPDQNPGNFTKAQAADKPSVAKTVAMEYSVIEGDASNVRTVKFYVYDGACTDATAGCGTTNSPRSDSADLDGAGAKFVPNLCTTCHGGTFYAPANALAPTLDDVKLGSSFLPFDIYTYRDGTAGPKPTDPAFGLADITAQEAAFYAQNQMVLATNPASAIQELINLSYPTGAVPFQQHVVPCGWRADTTIGTQCGGNFGGGTGDIQTETLYRDVVAPACRSCHVAQTPSIAWDTYNGFAGSRGDVDLGGSGYGIGGLVCNTGLMPHTSTTYTNFWRSNGPHQPNTLKNFSHAATPSSQAWAAFGTCAPP